MPRATNSSVLSSRPRRTWVALARRPRTTSTALAQRLFDAIDRTTAERVVIDGIDGFQRATAPYPDRTMSAVGAIGNELRGVQRGAHLVHLLSIMKVRDLRHRGGAPRPRTRGAMKARASSRGTSAARVAPVVLVVDDEVGTADVLASVLRDEGYEVDTAQNGRDALVKARAKLPAVVLLDFVMPILDGAETLRALRADPELASIPVIMMSGLPATMVSRRCGRHAAFLRKPFALDDLVWAVREQIRPPR